jgi:predicted nucleotide-binding protein
MSESPLPKLLVSQADAREKINAQIMRGRAIIEPLAPAHAGFGFGLAGTAVFEQAKADQEKWAKVTIDLLRSLFADLSIDNEFGSVDILYFPQADRPKLLAGWMTARIHHLESIINRLPFSPLGDKLEEAKAAPAPSKQQSKDIFIVHGHDEAAKHEVARFIEQLGLRAIILHEKPDEDKTIIEKVEHHSNVGFAVVLLTPDDVGHPKDTPSESKPRPRQNVVLELGYFIGILGRSRVCALLKGDIEIPTDYAGVPYKPMDNAGAWKYDLARDIKEAGINVAPNKALRPNKKGQPPF